MALLGGGRTFRRWGLVRGRWAGSFCHVRLQQVLPCHGFKNNRFSDCVLKPWIVVKTAVTESQLIQRRWRYLNFRILPGHLVESGWQRPSPEMERAVEGQFPQQSWGDWSYQGSVNGGGKGKLWSQKPVCATAKGCRLITPLSMHSQAT
jgi:hypothetical protein